MKILPTICVMMAFSLSGFSQDFSEKFSLVLPDTVSYRKAEWVDADSDRLLDVMLFARNSTGEELVFLFRNDSINGVTYGGYLKTGTTSAAYLLADFDGDNLVDIIISGMNQDQPLTTVFVNKGNFLFESAFITALSADLIRSADFDGDGARELLVTGIENGRPFLRILKRAAGGWATVHDSLAVHATGLEVFNFDSDNDVDFFVNGSDENGNVVCHANYNQGNFYFTREEVSPAVKGKTTRADLNYDGKFDVLLFGRDAAGVDHLYTFVNSGDGFTRKDSLLATHDTEIMAADLTSDGLLDVHSFGFLSNGDTLSAIFTIDRIDTLTHKNVLWQAFGDYERDGDLDLIQLRNSAAGPGIVLLENKTLDTNAPPKSPFDLIATRILNRIFLSWRVPEDDHTSSPSLTYDVTIQTTEENLMSGEFDLLSGRRLLVTHGNNTTGPYVLIRSSGSRPFYFDIQAIDNSYHAGPSGVCRGSGGNNEGCIQMETISMDACKNELLILEAEAIADWYSFTEGFLGHDSSLELTVSHADTLFSVERQPSGCTVITVYTVQTPPVVNKKAESSRLVCEGEIVPMGVESHWLEVEWSSSMRKFISREDSIDYFFSGPDTVKVVVSDGVGCHIQRNTILKMSKPEIVASPDAFQILKGEAVQLSVSGGVTYQWTPSSGLNDPLSPNPLASPVQTTQYQVTATDSAGCAGTTGVIVIVEQTAFIPNLFTPNNDGSNDALKIYGLQSVRDFSFTIYSREGNKVFHTNNVAEAVNIGWNGTYRGVDQPAGVYYWDVKGETDTGKSLRLNGKYSGAIVLLR